MSKFKTPPYILVPDTNILFAKNIGEIVRSSFHEDFQQCSVFASIRILIPEIVRDELLFQKFHIACKSNQNAILNHGHIALITGRSAPKALGEAYLKNCVRTVFNKWAKMFNAEIVKPPYSRIRWSKVIEAAVWRKPPFSLPTDDRDAESEKGFRDAIILETFKEICRVNSRDCVALLTNDGLLRQAVQNLRLPGNVSCYASMRELLSNLKLAHENRSKEFRAVLAANAQKAFYEIGSAECIYTKFNVPAEVQKRFGQAINALEEPVQGSRFLPAGHPVRTMAEVLKALSVALISDQPAKPSQDLAISWKPASDEKIHITETSYQNSTREGAMVWQTRLRFVRAFGHDGPDIIATMPGADDRLRTADVDVIWSAFSSQEAELSRLQLIDIKLVNVFFEPLTLEKRIQYRFSNPGRYVPLSQPNHG